jgi:replicative DNA helicase
MTYNKIATPQEQERACLACFLSFPHYLADYNGILKSSHFDNKVHAAIYTAMSIVYSSSSNTDPILISEKLISIGLTHYEGLSMMDYLETLSQISIKESSLIYYIGNIIKYDYARRADKTFDECKLEVRANIEKPLPELAGLIETSLKKAGTENIADEEDAIDVFGIMQDTVLSWGEEQKPISLKTPFPIFNHLYGGPSFGDLFVFSAGPKVGKSTLVNYLAYEIAGLPENNCKVLILDTELETKRILSRNLSSLSGVNEYKIKTGRFTSNISEKNKVYTALNALDKYKGRVHHKYIANKSIDEVISFARRWYAKNVRDGENCLIVYDYLKSTQENIKDAFQSYEILGVKTDKLKKLMSELPRTAGITAVQVNRSGGTAMSSQIEWHCSNLYRLEKKTPEEITEHGKDFGTHKLIEVRARVQGEGALGADNYIKKVTVEGEEYVDNFINFKIENFGVTECGSAVDIYNKQLETIDISSNKGKLWI